jgi:hypothetical protein
MKIKLLAADKTATRTNTENPLPLKEPEKIPNGIRGYCPTNGTPSMGAQGRSRGHLPPKEPEKIPNGIRRYCPTNGTPSMGAVGLTNYGVSFYNT